MKSLAAIHLLKQLIAIPSFSKSEDKTADLLEEFIHSYGVKSHRKGNNVWFFNQHYDANKPSVLLNSHHDTVKPNDGYTHNPFEAIEIDGKLFGLGSNDAGGCLVSLLATALHFYAQENLPYNIVFAASAEEEISGTGGIELIWNELGNIEIAIVGEPTQMHLAIAEKGLLVLDCEVKGKSGHAARAEGENAIYKALKDITWFSDYQFPKKSATLGEMKMTVSQINAGTQHNVVPDKCQFVVDIRLTDAYTHEEVLAIVAQNVSCNFKARSLRIKPSSIPITHPLVLAGIALGRNTYGSPTTSDKALMPCTSLKIGPCDSARSHTADEFIYLNEIEEGIDLYVKLLTNFFKQSK